MMKRKVRLFENGTEGPRFCWEGRLVKAFREEMEKIQCEKKVLTVGNVCERVRKFDGGLWEQVRIMALIYKNYVILALEDNGPGEDLILRIRKL